MDNENTELNDTPVETATEVSATPEEVVAVETAPETIPTEVSATDPAEDTSCDSCQ